MSETPGGPGGFRPESSAELNDLGDLVALVPVLIGFHPQDSLVVLGTGGPNPADHGRLPLIMRGELPARELFETAADQVLQVLVREQADGAAILVVGGAAPAHAAAKEWCDLALLVADRLDRHGIDPHTVIRTDHTRAGGTWQCLTDCGCHGQVPDSSASPLAAAAAVDGRVVYASRDALDRLVAPADAQRLQRRAQLLAAAGDATGPLDALTGLAVLGSAAAQTAAGQLELGDSDIVALSRALRFTSVHNAAVLWSAGCCPPLNMQTAAPLRFLTSGT